jgi:hypothetical protein
VEVNRTEIQTKLSPVTSALLREKGFISPVDVFLRLGCLDPKDHEAWRLGRVPYLESVIHGSLGRINFIMATLRRSSLAGGLKPSWTAYRSWGKTGGKQLRFTKSGAPHLEEAYATHFVKNEKMRGHSRASDATSEPAPGAASSAHQR